MGTIGADDHDLSINLPGTKFIGDVLRKQEVEFAFWKIIVDDVQNGRCTAKCAAKGNDFPGQILPSFRAQKAQID